jgi:hypothetical protein
MAQQGSACPAEHRHLQGDTVDRRRGEPSPLPASNLECGSTTDHRQTPPDIN